ncbi:terminase small subunit [Escherichia coli]|uniref:type IV toxin-antitoxin system AbiEi family antitoxin domain-containing protein n=1 Tax=Salmonella enterica TaxID=28901 RepID=UPI0020C3A448|nr:type IV toxin-antitoxin system AbiEi family antitoxin domain-containing protein [Salmonella enterica]EKI8352492.1 terminase small subunit [Escherichia coli]UTK77716.1 terminase small subunit [Salmonella enterica subsp. enterica serovar Mbandaka]HCJ9305094.1 terminase small subunit [Escherichia coli]
MSKLTDMMVTDADLAELTGLSSRRIRQLVESGRLTRAGRNRYQLAEVFMALVEEMSGGDKASELTAERVRKLRAEATLAELELAKQRGEVAPIDEFQSVWANRFTIIRANMLQLPQRVVTMLIGETDERRFKQVMTEEIKQILTAAASSGTEADYGNED